MRKRTLALLLAFVMAVSCFGTLAGCGEKTPFDKPANIEYSATGKRITFAAVAGASAYSYEIRKAGGEAALQQDDSLTDNMISVAALATGDYNVKIRANAKGRKTASEWAEKDFTVSSSLAKLGAPQNLAVSQGLTVTWDAVSGADGGYTVKVFEKLSPANVAVNDALAAADENPSYQITAALTPETAYTVQVYANAVEGKFQQSDVSSTDFNAPVAPLTALPAPSGLSKSGDTLSWNRVENASQGYSVTVFDKDNTSVVKVPPTGVAQSASPSFSLSGITFAPATYTVEVYAKAVEDEYLKSVAASINFTVLQTLKAPEDLEINNDNDKISWSAVTATTLGNAVSGAVTYAVKAYGTGANASAGVVVNEMTTDAWLNLQGDEFTFGADYKIEVYATAGGYYQSAAAVYDFTAALEVLAAPQNLAITLDYKTITWDACANASAGYTVRVYLTSTPSTVIVNDAQAAQSASPSFDMSGHLPLNDYTDYTISVYANAVAGLYNQSAATLKTFGFALPTLATPTALTRSGAAISWTGDSNAASYTLALYNTDNDELLIVDEKALAAQSFSLASLTLTAGTYEFRVYANAVAGQYRQSAAASQTFTFTKLGNPAVARDGWDTVSWGTVSGAADYTVKVKLASNGQYVPAAQADNISATSYTFNFAALAVDTYTIEVYANAAAGVNEGSAGSCSFAVPAKLTAPSGLDWQEHDDGIIVSWNTLAAATAGYVLEIYKAAGDILIKTYDTAAGVTSQVVKVSDMDSVPAGTECYAYVYAAAIKTGGDSAYRQQSNASAVSDPIELLNPAWAQPQNLAVSEIAKNLTWNVVSGAPSYTVTIMKGATQVASGTVSTNSFDLSTVDLGGNNDYTATVKVNADATHRATSSNPKVFKWMTFRFQASDNSGLYAYGGSQKPTFNTSAGNLVVTNSTETGGWPHGFAWRNVIPTNMFIPAGSTYIVDIMVSGTSLNWHTMLLKNDGGYMEDGWAYTGPACDNGVRRTFTLYSPVDTYGLFFFNDALKKPGETGAVAGVTVTIYSIRIARPINDTSSFINVVGGSIGAISLEPGWRKDNFVDGAAFDYGTSPMVVRKGLDGGGHVFKLWANLPAGAVITFDLTLVTATGIFVWGLEDSGLVGDALAQGSGGEVKLSNVGNMISTTKATKGIWFLCNNTGAVGDIIMIINSITITLP